MIPAKPPLTPRPGLIRRTLRDRWLPILALWIAGTLVLGVVVHARIRPAYRASSLIRVDSLPEDLFNVRPNRVDMETFLATQVQLISSPSVLAIAATDPRARALPRIQSAGDVVQELKRVIGVNVIPGTSLIEIGMLSESPSEAATLVNAVVEAFLKSQNEWSVGMARNRVDTLEDYLADLKRKSDEVDKAWRMLLSRIDAQVFVKGQDKPAEITLEEFKQIYRQLFETRLELAVAEQRAAAVKAAASNAEKNPDSPADEELLRQKLESRFKQDPQVIELASQRMEAKARLDEIRRIARPADDRAGQEAMNKLKALDDRYDQLWEAMSRQLRAEIMANKPDLKIELLEAEARVRALGARQKVLQDQFDRLDVRNRRKAADEVDLALIREERESLRAMREAVSRRLEQLRFEQKAGERVRIFSPAIPPGSPVSDPRVGLMALIPFVMLPVAFGLVLGVGAISGTTGPAATDPAREEPPAEV